MDRIARIDELLKVKISEFISRELEVPNSLVTVLDVRTSKDLRYANVWVSILPEKLTGTALEKLRAGNHLLASFLRKQSKLPKVPIFRWQADRTETKATVIEDLIKKDEQELNKIIKNAR
jgi:ribosome-binding factor A